MPGLAEQKQGNYTYKDYLSWSNDNRYEIINGYAYNMTPAPSVLHQQIAVELTQQIANQLLDQLCQVFSAPFDVRFVEKNQNPEDALHVVQPNISVVCDKSKLDEKGCIGAPDFIIEIVSPATAQLDYIKKLALYENYGVKEYWIIQPIDKVVMVYHLNEQGQYARPLIYTAEDVVEVEYPSLRIELSLVFKI